MSTKLHEELIGIVYDEAKELPKQFAASTLIIFLAYLLGAFVLDSFISGLLKNSKSYLMFLSLIGIIGFPVGIISALMGVTTSWMVLNCSARYKEMPTISNIKSHILGSSFYWVKRDVIFSGFGASIATLFLGAMLFAVINMHSGEAADAGGSGALDSVALFVSNIMTIIMNVIWSIQFIGFSLNRFHRSISMDIHTSRIAANSLMDQYLHAIIILGVIIATILVPASMMGVSMYLTMSVALTLSTLTAATIVKHSIGVRKKKKEVKETKSNIVFA
ncbi:membrane hypothetical protein [Vibrio chagasii]|nr:membrane hypothetical protein [Vibrio chagasii]